VSAKDVVQCGRVPLCGKRRVGKVRIEENEAGGTRGRMQDRRVVEGANCQLETEKEAGSLLVQSNQTFSTRPPARPPTGDRPNRQKMTKNDPYIT